MSKAALTTPMALSADHSMPIHFHCRSNKCDVAEEREVSTYREAEYVEYDNLLFGQNLS